MRTTPIMGLPFVEAGDPIAQAPGVIEALAEGVENSAFVPPKPAGDLWNTYPKGVSVMTLTAVDAANGWPLSVSATVVTTRRGLGDTASQLWYRTAGNQYTEIRYRSTQSVNGDWGPWIIVAGPGTPRAVHTGSYIFDASSSNKSKTIAFPAGLFETAPIVVCSGSTRDATMTATAVTKDGMTVNMGPESGAGSIARRVSWNATEMNLANL